jgi:hypothetical protein
VQKRKRASLDVTVSQVSCWAPTLGELLGSGEGFRTGQLAIILVLMTGSIKSSQILTLKHPHSWWPIGISFLLMSCDELKNDIVVLARCSIQSSEQQPAPAPGVHLLHQPHPRAVKQRIENLNRYTTINKRDEPLLRQADKLESLQLQHDLHLSSTISKHSGL